MTLVHGDAQSFCQGVKLGQRFAHSCWLAAPHKLLNLIHTRSYACAKIGQPTAANSFSEATFPDHTPADFQLSPAICLEACPQLQCCRVAQERYRRRKRANKLQQATKLWQLSKDGSASLQSSSHAADGNPASDCLLSSTHSRLPLTAHCTFEVSISSNTGCMCMLAVSAKSTCWQADMAICRYCRMTTSRSDIRLCSWQNVIPLHFSSVQMASHQACMCIHRSTMHTGGSAPLQVSCAMPCMASLSCGA